MSGETGADDQAENPESGRVEAPWGSAAAGTGAPMAEVSDAGAERKTSPEPQSTTVAVRSSSSSGLRFTNALRPFKRPWSRGRRWELDLPSTIDAYVRSHELIPALRPAPERWFEVDVVVDASPHMAIWGDVVGDLVRSLRQSGTFRTQHVWDFVLSGAEPGLRDVRGRKFSIDRRKVTSGRRLTIVVSDCADRAWTGGRAWEVLRGWSQSLPVVLINPLSPSLWWRTGLDLPGVRVGAPPTPGSGNTRLRHWVPSMVRALSGEDEEWVPLPVVSLSAYSLGRWARTLMRIDGMGCDAVLVPSRQLLDEMDAGVCGRAGDAGGDEWALGAESGEDAAEAAAQRAVVGFLHSASPEAARLATLAAPHGRVSLTFLEFLRKELVPEASVADLAEVLISGLVGFDADAEDPKTLRFREGVGPILGDMLDAQDAWEMHDVFADHLASQAARIDLGAIDVQDPRAVAALPSDLRTYAIATRTALQVLGIARADDQIEAYSDATAPVPLSEQQAEQERELGSSERSGDLTRQAEAARVSALRAHLAFLMRQVLAAAVREDLDSTQPPLADTIDDTLVRPAPVQQSVFDLVNFSVTDMVVCADELRGVVTSATTMEEASRLVIDYLRSAFTDPATGRPAFALARMFHTVTWDRLTPELRSVVATRDPAAAANNGLPYLTLLATAGDHPHWTDRRNSRDHQAIPLAASDVVRRAPLALALLDRLLGVQPVDPDGPFASTAPASPDRFDMVHVPEALGSPYVPTPEFVRDYQIRSAIALGAVLDSGRPDHPDLPGIRNTSFFTVLLYSRVRIPGATASHFRTLAAAIQLALTHYLDAPLFSLGARVAEFSESPQIIQPSEEPAPAPRLTVRHIRPTAPEELLFDLGQFLVRERDPRVIVQLATDAATAAISAEFGACFYTMTTLGGQVQTRFVLSGGTPATEFERLPMPRLTQLVGAAQFPGLRPIRCIDVTTDPRYGGRAPFHGLPPGHPPVRSYLAAPVTTLGVPVRGALYFGHKQRGIFTERDERIVTSIAAQVASALANNASPSRSR